MPRSAPVRFRWLPPATLALALLAACGELVQLPLDGAIDAPIDALLAPHDGTPLPVDASPIDASAADA